MTCSSSLCVCGATCCRQLELCLTEASRCDLFIALLGERYGWQPAYNVADDPRFDWLSSYPEGASVTELEIHSSVLAKGAEMREKAFFYLRDNSFQRYVARVTQATRLFPSAKETFGVSALLT